MDKRTGRAEAQAAIGGALLVGVLAGASGGGGLALVAGLTGLAGLVTFLGATMIVAALMVLATIMGGIRQQAHDEESPWRR